MRSRYAITFISFFFLFVISAHTACASDSELMLSTKSYVQSQSLADGFSNEIAYGKGAIRKDNSLQLSFRDEINNNNMLAKSAYLGGLTVINYLQTYTNLYKDNGSELNPMLGPHPSRTKLTASVIITTCAIYTLAYLAPKPLDKLFLDSVNRSMEINIEWDQLVKDKNVRRPAAMPIVLSIRF